MTKTDYTKTDYLLAFLMFVVITLVVALYATATPPHLPATPPHLPAYVCILQENANVVPVTALPQHDSMWIHSTNDHAIPIASVRECMRVPE